MPADTKVPAKPAAVRQFTVATYNVHSCVGLDRRCDPGRVAEVIAELDTDIIALQEVDSRRREPGRRAIDQFEFLAKATNMEPVPGPSLVDHVGCFGNVLLSRWPVTRVQRRDISVDRREPRGAIGVRVATGRHVLEIVSTHLGLSMRERRRQTRELLQLVGEGLKDEADGLIRLGDLNEWRRTGGTLRPLGKVLRPLPPLSSFPSWRPLLPLDRIFITGRIHPHQVEAHRSPLSRIASDHLPVRAVLEWTGGSSAPGDSEPGAAACVAPPDERSSRQHGAPDGAGHG